MSVDVLPAAPTFSGMIVAGALSTAPTGWLLCDGSAVSRTTYATLFGAIGTTYGVGDGSTTFNVPDLRERFPLGAGATHALGATAGASTHVHGTAGATQNGSLAALMEPSGAFTYLQQFNIPTTTWTANLTITAAGEAASAQAGLTIGNAVAGATATAAGPIDPCVAVSYFIRV
jgi:microcystin-dependent protein